MTYPSWSGLGLPSYMQQAPNILAGTNQMPDIGMPDLPGADQFAKMNQMDKMLPMMGLSLLAGNRNGGKKFSPWMLAGLAPMAMKGLGIF